MQEERIIVERCRDDFATPFANLKRKFSASISAATALTVPGGGVGNYVAVIKATGDIWVACFGKTAAVPAGASFAETESELNPTAKMVKSGDVLNIIPRTGTVQVSVVFYKVHGIN